MKCVLFLALVATMVLAANGHCTRSSDCSEGQCCTGGFYNRRCQSLADNGRPCQAENKFDQYSVGCPCKEGLVCSTINYCQQV